MVTTITAIIETIILIEIKIKITLEIDQQMDLIKVKGH